MLWLLKITVCVVLAAGLVLAVLRRAGRRTTRWRFGVTQENALVIGFFHPFCAGGGGGERVLWRAVRNLARLSETLGRPLHVLIYTGDIGSPPAKILAGVSRQFQITIDVNAVPVHFVYVRSRGLLHAKLYPIFTMLAQSVASMILAAEAVTRATPDVFVDTTGFAFAFPIAWLAGCKIGAYVHYPTISTDMLSRVRNQRPSHNNRSWISSSTSVSRAKLLYYQAFARLYGTMGRFASTVMVNSTWTRAHIASLWKVDPAIVYPPCDTSELETLPISDDERNRCIVSVGQFRPEKDHALQVRALAALKGVAPGGKTTAAAAAGATAAAAGAEIADLGVPLFPDVRLVILGSCRNEDDRAVLDDTRSLAKELGVGRWVEFIVNCSFQELKGWLGRASVGVHTMWNEHFGIGVVEMMAAGMVTIAHRSGGPAADIVVPLPDGGVTGLLATTPEEYAEAMARVFRSKGCRESKGDGSSSRSNLEELDKLDSAAVRSAGRQSARRFSNEIFDRRFSAVFAELLHTEERSYQRRRDERKED